MLGIYNNEKQLSQGNLVRSKFVFATNKNRCVYSQEKLTVQY